MSSTFLSFQQKIRPEHYAPAFAIFTIIRSNSGRITPSICRATVRLSMWTAAAMSMYCMRQTMRCTAISLSSELSLH